MLDAVSVARLTGYAVGFVCGPFALSALILFPLDAIAAIVQRLTNANATSERKPLNRQTAFRAWIGLSFVLIALEVLAALLGR